MIRSARQSIRPQGYSTVSASPRVSDRQPAPRGVCAVTARKAVMGVTPIRSPRTRAAQLTRFGLHRMKRRAPLLPPRQPRVDAACRLARSCSGHKLAFASLVAVGGTAVESVRVRAAAPAPDPGKSARMPTTAGGTPQVRPRLPDRVPDNLGERARPTARLFMAWLSPRGSMQP